MHIFLVLVLSYSIASIGCGRSSHILCERRAILQLASTWVLIFPLSIVVPPVLCVRCSLNVNIRLFVVADYLFVYRVCWAMSKIFLWYYIRSESNLVISSSLKLMLSLTSFYLAQPPAYTLRAPSILVNLLAELLRVPSHARLSSTCSPSACTECQSIITSSIRICAMQVSGYVHAADAIEVIVIACHFCPCGLCFLFSPWSSSRSRPPALFYIPEHSLAFLLELVLWSSSEIATGNVNILLLRYNYQIVNVTQQWNSDLICQCCSSTISSLYFAWASQSSSSLARLQARTWSRCLNFSAEAMRWRPISSITLSSVTSRPLNTFHVLVHLDMKRPTLPPICCTQRQQA